MFLKLILKFHEVSMFCAIPATPDPHVTYSWWLDLSTEQCQDSGHLSPLIHGVSGEVSTPHVWSLLPVSCIVQCLHWLYWINPSPEWDVCLQMFFLWIRFLGTMFNIKNNVGLLTKNKNLLNIQCYDISTYPIFS